MKKQSKILENILKANDKYELKVGNMYIEMEYNNNEKSFKECVLNILKQKL